MEKEKNNIPSDNTTPAILFGLTVLFVVFGILGGWMYYAPLATSSVASGQVSAGSAKKTVQHLDGGIVKAIHVKDGDIVKKGDILIELEDVQIKENLNILKSQYQDMTATYDRLKAQRDNRDSIKFSKVVTDQNIIDNQKSIFYTNKKSLKDEDTITQKRILQTKKQISSLKALINSMKKRLKSIAKERREQEILFQQQLVDKLRIQELDREANSIEGDIESKLADIARLNEQISELKTQQLLRKKKFKEETLDKLVQTKSKIEDLKSKIIATEDKLKRTKIISPASGTIIGLKMHTIGGVIGRGQDILEIVPQDAKLIIIAKVQTTDIDNVRVGLVSNIMFPAFNAKKLHVINGKVIEVSADSFEDKATRQPYYEAKVELTKEGEEELAKNGFTLVAGMPATVMIQTGTRTALDYFIKPFKDMAIRGFNEE
jgi:epimerase transport system membrane fusion protein